MEYYTMRHISLLQLNHTFLHDRPCMIRVKFRIFGSHAGEGTGR